MTMSERLLNLDGLPEPFARAIEHLVHVAHEEFAKARPSSEKKPLSTRPGHVIGNLSREEIYEDLDEEIVLPPKPGPDSKS